MDVGESTSGADYKPFVCSACGHLESAGILLLIHIRRSHPDVGEPACRLINWRPVAANERQRLSQLAAERAALQHGNVSAADAAPSTQQPADDVKPELTTPTCDAAVVESVTTPPVDENAPLPITSTTTTTAAIVKEAETPPLPSPPPPVRALSENNSVDSFDVPAPEERSRRALKRPARYNATTPNSAPTVDQSTTHGNKRRRPTKTGAVVDDAVANTTLPDYLQANLDVVFVGLRPGRQAATQGHYYVHSSNLFWKCLRMFDLLPGDAALTNSDDFRLPDFGIGLANLFHSETAFDSQPLSPASRAAAARLEHSLTVYLPRVVVFNGKSTYEHFIGECVDRKRGFRFGLQLQPRTLCDGRLPVFVLPSTSGALAVSMASRRRHFEALRTLLAWARTDTHLSPAHLAKLRFDL